MLSGLWPLFTGADEERSIHAHSLQHVFGLVSGEFGMEPWLPKVTVLLGYRLAKNLLKGRTL